MSDNPLAGVSIPSIEEIVDESLSRLNGVVDFGSPMQKHRLKSYLLVHLTMHFQFELERALLAVTDKAIKHTFAVMRDGDYQEKRKVQKQKRAAKREQSRKEREAREKFERMEATQKSLKVEKVVVN